MANRLFLHTLRCFLVNDLFDPDSHYFCNQDTSRMTHQILSNAKTQFGTPYAEEYVQLWDFPLLSWFIPLSKMTDSSALPEALWTQQKMCTRQRREHLLRHTDGYKMKYLCNFTMPGNQDQPEKHADKNKEVGKRIYFLKNSWRNFSLSSLLTLKAAKTVPNPSAVRNWTIWRMVRWLALFFCVYILCGVCFATEDIGVNQGIAVPWLQWQGKAGPGAAAGTGQTYWVLREGWGTVSHQHFSTLYM